jgi:hypothetical protein
MTVIASPGNQVKVIAGSPNGVNVTARTGPAGPAGPPGPAGAAAQWDSMTQAEYDALPDKDPNTLYVIVP